MTINRSFIPDPPPSEHAQAPPTHAHSNLPADAGVWAAARASYAEGCSSPVVAERHGLNERTVRRRAASEDWRSLRAGRRLRPSAGLFGVVTGEPAPIFAGEPPDGEDELDRLPHLRQFVDAHSFEVGELLLHPDPDRLSRFAFRRSAECAARGAAAESLGWMRLVQSIDRIAARLDCAAKPFSGPDYMRAAYAAELSRRVEGDMQDEAGPEGGDEAAARTAAGAAAAGAAAAGAERGA